MPTIWKASFSLLQHVFLFWKSMSNSSALSFNEPIIYVFSSKPYIYYHYYFLFLFSLPIPQIGAGQTSFSIKKSKHYINVFTTVMTTLCLVVSSVDYPVSFVIWQSQLAPFKNLSSKVLNGPCYLCGPYIQTLDQNFNPMGLWYFCAYVWKTVLVKTLSNPM